MTFDEIYTTVARILEQNPNRFNTPDTVTADLIVTGAASGVIGATIKNGKTHIKKGSTIKPDATVTISGENLTKLLEGKLKPVIALVTGKIKVTGDYDKLMKVVKSMRK